MVLRLSGDTPLRNCTFLYNSDLLIELNQCVTEGKSESVIEPAGALPHVTHFVFL